MSTKRGDPRLSRAYRKARLEVLARDNYTCQYCGEAATTVDHAISIKAGGDPVSRENLLACCVNCNSKKGSRSQSSFLGNMRTPPVFSSIISPIRSRPVKDSPFIDRPHPEGS